MTEQILSPEEVRTIIVDRYDEYDLPDKLPDIIEEVNYAEGVDKTLMDVPADPDAPPGATNNAKN